ncbi:hypothetical protein [Massilia sp. METH4]|uniref:hypothetical protein n=1 Tax=Massilia sp. METH4 TaxID=3123041 RepID=UPI0030D44B4D
MSQVQLTGDQMNALERLWARVMIAAGVTLITVLVLMYVISGSWTIMLVFGAVTGASVVVVMIAAAKLRALERGLHESDREKRGDMHSALETLDD